MEFEHLNRNVFNNNFEEVGDVFFMWSFLIITSEEI